MKNIVNICAIKSNSPIATNTIAIIPDTDVAYTGSCVSPTPFSMRWFNLGIGSTLSRASIWSVLGATIIEPRAEENAAAANPT